MIALQRVEMSDTFLIILAFPLVSNSSINCQMIRSIMSDGFMFIQLKKSSR